MTHPWITWHRLSPRSGAGLACDQHGVALGPVALIAARQRRYRLRPPADEN